MGLMAGIGAGVLAAAQATLADTPIEAPVGEADFSVMAMFLRATIIFMTWSETGPACASHVGNASFCCGIAFLQVR